MIGKTLLGVKGDFVVVVENYSLIQCFGAAIDVSTNGAWTRWDPGVLTQCLIIIDFRIMSLHLFLHVLIFPRPTALVHNYACLVPLSLVSIFFLASLELMKATYHSASRERA